MVSAGHALGFALASLVLIVVPGPGVLFVVGRALAHGLAMIGVGVTVAITGRHT